MVTQQEARDMWAAIQQFQAFDEAQLESERQAKLAVAQAWWDGIKPAVPTTKAEALAVFQFIEAEIVTQKTNFANETDPIQKDLLRIRVSLLSRKLRQANEKFKERKLNG